MGKCYIRFHIYYLYIEMKIQNVEFLKSVSINNSKIFFENRSEVIFVWRSNVGKSSLMNGLFNRKNLVKTSSQPGKTRTANIFIANNKYYFTDLPGYWFAKMGKERREDLDSLISWYVEERRWNIKKVVLIVDSKIGPQQSDIDMFKYIQGLELPVLIVLSKVDKLSKSDTSKSLKHAEDIFFGQEIITASVKKNQWLRQIIVNLWEAFKS